MRRILSILLLLVMALPLAAPAFGLSTQQKLMLCCRKGAVHHCAGNPDAPDETPTVRQHCNACPRLAPAGHADGLTFGSRSVADAAASISPLRIRQVEAGYRISFSRSRQKRGPPAVVLS